MKHRGRGVALPDSRKPLAGPDLHRSYSSGLKTQGGEVLKSIGALPNLHARAGKVVLIHGGHAACATYSHFGDLLHHGSAMQQGMLWPRTFG